jgi:hypothetical protein
MTERDEWHRPGAVDATADIASALDRYRRVVWGIEHGEAQETELTDAEDALYAACLAGQSGPGRRARAQHRVEQLIAEIEGGA